MISITLNLAEPEIATIRTWYEYATSDRFNFGGPPLPFPTEQLVLAKLTSHRHGPIELSRSEVNCIADWMEQSIDNKYGSERFVFGYEETVYRKIRNALESLETDRLPGP